MALILDNGTTNKQQDQRANAGCLLHNCELLCHI